MQKIAFFLFVITLLFPPGVFAQTQINPVIISQTPLKQELKQELQAAREQMQKQRAETKELFREKREAYKAQLMQIKDVRKQTIITSVDQKIQTINTRRTTHMSEKLTQMEGILEKIASKAALSKQQGYDTTAVETALSEAREKMDTAQSLLSAQADKDYVFEITDETALKTTIGQTVQSFTADLKTVYQAVVATRKAILDAARELGRIRSQTLDTPQTKEDTL